MSFNLDKGFEIENGLIFAGEAGLISFSGNPTGNPSPVGTLCKDPRGLVWRKFGLPNNDWEIIGFDRDSVTMKPFYNGGQIEAINYYNSPTQIDGNRIARSTYTYSGGLLDYETVSFYDVDGVSVLNTVTYTIQYSGGLLSNVIKS